MSIPRKTIKITNQRQIPIIGIVSSPTPKHLPKCTSYIPVSYVKWIQMSGARVVPIIYDEYTNNPFVLSALLDNLNGVLFIGGGTNNRKMYSKKSFLEYIEIQKNIYEYAKEKNSSGIVYPLFGTCLGFEMMGMFAMHDTNEFDAVDIQNGFYEKTLISDSVKHGSYPLNMNDSTRKQMKLTRTEQKQMLKTDTIYTSHNLGFNLNASYGKNLKKNLIITSTYADNGKKHVNMFEHKDYPFFGVHFHPEIPLFDWRQVKINRTQTALKLGGALSNFFVGLARKNDNKWNNDHFKFNEFVISAYDLHSRQSIAKSLGVSLDDFWSQRQFYFF